MCFLFWNFENVNSILMAEDKREIINKKCALFIKRFVERSKRKYRHSMLSFLSSLPISVLHVPDTEANKFYDINHPVLMLR